MKRRKLYGRTVSMSVTTLLIVLSHPASANDWPAFRGTRGDGIARTESVFPASGEFGLEVSWKKTIGSGYSGIAVAEGVAVTGFSDGTKDVLIAFDLKTGADRWRFEIEDTYVGHDGSHTGPIATPTIVGGRVYGLGAWGRLFALNVNDGSLVWSTHLTDDHEAAKPHYGFSTSPFVRDGVLIVQGGAKDAALTGFDANTGKLLWKSGEDSTDYQSPVDYDDGGVELMLAPSSKKLFAFSPKTGEIAWQFEHNGTGAIGAASLSAVPTTSGNIFLSNKDDGSTVFSVSGSAESFKAGVQWESKSIRNSYNVPIYHAGYIYAFSSRFLTCVDAETGKAAWRSRAPGDGFLILVDGHLVVVTKKTGEVHIIPATSEGFTSVASTPVLGDLSWAHPSFADNAIFVRSMGEIARVDIRKGGASVASARPANDEAGAGKLARFLSKIKSSPKKQATVDAFMKTVETFPLTEGNMVHFLYQGKGSDLAVGSDLFGARQERSMTRVSDTNLFYYSVKLELNARVNYVFIRDFEDHIVDPRNSRQTKSNVYGKEMAMNFRGEPMDMSWFAMPGWKAPTFFATPDARNQGEIKSHVLESKIIEDVKIELDVYLPAGDAKANTRYPVAYVFGGKEAMEIGEMPRALDNLIGKSVQPIIAVFISASGRISAEKMSESFATEVIPYIDRNFRTQPRREARACIGAGFSGESAIATAFAKSDLVGKVGTLSMFSFGSVKKGLIPNVTTAKEQPMQLYMDWGKYDLRSPDEAWDIAETNRDFVKYLRVRGFNPKGGELNEGTGWSSWKNRTEAVFSALFPNK